MGLIPWLNLNDSHANSQTKVSSISSYREERDQLKLRKWNNSLYSMSPMWMKSSVTTSFDWGMDVNQLVWNSVESISQLFNNTVDARNQNPAIEEKSNQSAWKLKKIVSSQDSRFGVKAVRPTALSKRGSVNSSLNAQLEMSESRESDEAKNF